MSDSTVLDTSLDLMEGEGGVQDRIFSTAPYNESQAREGRHWNEGRANLGRSKNSTKLSGPVSLFLPDGKGVVNKLFKVFWRSVDHVFIRLTGQYFLLLF